MKDKRLRLQKKNKSYSFKDSPLYNLNSKRKLASLLFTDINKLRDLQSDNNYNTFDVGIEKVRTIECPQKKLDLIHTRIASLLCRITTPDYLHSGVEKRSNVTNARSHVGFHPVFTTDIRSFFPSTSRKKVFEFFFHTLKCSSDVADILSKVCTYNDHIPTGSRISMPLAFWANNKMFDDLYRYSISRNTMMTVYVDDLTFSGNEIDDSFAYNVKSIISQHHHEAHPFKSKLYPTTSKKLITGVIVDGNDLRVRNKLLKSIHENFHQWISEMLDSNETMNSIKPKLLGRLNAASNIDKRFKDKIRTFNQMS